MNNKEIIINRIDKEIMNRLLHCYRPKFPTIKDQVMLKDVLSNFILNVCKEKNKDPENISIEFLGDTIEIDVGEYFFID